MKRCLLPYLLVEHTYKSVSILLGGEDDVII